MVVDGAYRALLGRECDWNERADQLAAEMMAEHGYCYHRDRRLTELLEAGELVTLRRSTVESALWWLDRSQRRVLLPFDRRVKFVAVSSSDHVSPAADLAWEGAVGEGRDVTKRS
jgi:hypothetical protein